MDSIGYYIKERDKEMMINMLVAKVRRKERERTKNSKVHGGHHNPENAHR